MSPEQISLKANNTGIKPVTGKQATLAYVAPFAVFIAMLAVRPWTTLLPEQLAVMRFTLVLAALIVFSRKAVAWRPSLPAGSLLLGVAIFAVWIGPDALWPEYRHLWLFRNPVTGSAASSLPLRLKSSILFIAIRVLESAVLVPVVEELFWRGWLMRWLIHSDFQEVPLGRYTPFSFWMVALLFASEHGPYWEVGLIAGVAYNWWIVRTRSLADCMLAHAITNALLAAYVLLFDRWQYWL
jgi:CAAX prenyl protease-like protein